MEHTPTRRPAGSRLLLPGALLLGWTLPVVSLMLLAGVWPRTPVGLLLCVTVGPIAALLPYALLEWVLLGGIAPRLHTRLHTYTLQRATSVLRIAVLLAEALVILAVAAALVVLVAAVVPLDGDAAAAFRDRHFRTW